MWFDANGRLSAEAQSGGDNWKVMYDADLEADKCVPRDLEL